MKLKKKNKDAAVKYWFKTNFKYYYGKITKEERYDYPQHNNYILEKEKLKAHKFYQDPNLSKQILQYIQLPKDQITIKVDYRIVQLCKWHLDIIRDRIIEVNHNYQQFYNDNKIGLDVLIEDDEVKGIKVFKSDFFSNYLTNRQEYADRFSNPIGVQLLCISSDGKLIIPRQGFNNAVHQGKYIATASGSMDWEDYEVTNNLKESIEYAMVRELAEENSISDQSINMAMKFMGCLFIKKMRCKTDFFSIAYIDCKAYELKCSRDETFDREEYSVLTGVEVDVEKFKEQGYFDFGLVDEEKIETLYNEFLYKENVAEELKAVLEAFVQWLNSDEDKKVEFAEYKTIIK